jgi:hypothetical protein
MNNTALLELKAMDRATVLHPFTVAGDYEKGAIDPFVVETGKGVRITGMDGTSLLDAFGGLPMPFRRKRTSWLITTLMPAIRLRHWRGYLIV